MLASLIIVFREVLEAALVVTILLGATRGLRGRWPAVGWGIASGVFGAALVAALIDRISQAASGAGQSLLEAGVLLAAVAMLGWQNVWMSRHGRKLAEDLKRLGRDVSLGVKPMLAIYGATALAVVREGSEIVLFLYGVALSGAHSFQLVLGGLFGLAAAVALSFVLYQGLIRIPIRHLFRVTGWMILLLAAGMASQAAAFLNQAGFLPALKESLWDTSWLLSAQSLLGVLLKALFGYTPNPSGIQLVFYITTLLVIGALMKLAHE